MDLTLFHLLMLAEIERERWRGVHSLKPSFRQPRDALPSPTNRES